jgi:hypothetical protein
MMMTMVPMPIYMASGLPGPLRDHSADHSG